MKLFDFSESDPLVRCGIINDGVMGGLSTSRFEISGGGKALFSGTVSLEHGGGFASVKTTPHRFDLGGYKGVRLRVKGDGKRYSFRIRMTEDIHCPAYEAPFGTVEGKWIDSDLSFEAFVPSTKEGASTVQTPSIRRGSYSSGL